MTVFAKTLAGMKARIASEVRRTNIPDDIAMAIDDAITTYQGDRFYYSEAIFDFPTVAAQEWYGADTVPNIGLIVKLDYVKCFNGNLPYDLSPVLPSRIEYLNANGANAGNPLMFCYYTQRLRFYPVPNDVFTIRIGAQMIPAAPLNDDEINNPWMTGLAERLIRSRAKYELALHRIKDDALAQTMTAACDDAKQQLRELTNKKDQQGDWSVTPTQF